MDTRAKYVLYPLSTVSVTSVLVASRNKRFGKG